MGLDGPKVGEATYLAQISHLVEQSLLFRPQAEKQAELLAVRLARLLAWQPASRL